MGDLGDYFRENKEYFKKQREKRYKRNMQFLLKVTGYERREITPYQHRFSTPELGEFCDLYPTNQRYHNLVTGEKGTYKTAQGYLRIQAKRTREYLANQANAQNR